MNTQIFKDFIFISNLWVRLGKYEKFSGECGELKEKKKFTRTIADKIYEYVNNSLKIGHDIPVQIIYILLISHFV